jgi:CBS domain-containing protein
MDVIRWLSKKGGLSNATKNAPSGTVMSGEPYCVKLSGNQFMLQTKIQLDKVFDALKGCITQGFMGCAVLDGEGRVVANLSVSDLRVCQFHLLNSKGTSHLSFHQSMKETVEKFLSDMKKFAKVPICCKEKDSFESVVHSMFQNHIHRVYVVDSNNKPIGVISTTDVMKQLLKDL